MSGIGTDQEVTRMMRRKARKAGFRRPGGMDYLEYLGAIHDRYLFDWYLEIGCRNGRSFAPVRGKTIAVDPFFRIRKNVIGTKPALFVFQQTSDAFFASDFLSRNRIRLGFSFLDGLHRMEFLLRDFINTEAASSSQGVIALHDCCPFSHQMTLRDHRLLPPRAAWTGDVWKLIPILQHYRPDLKIEVLDCQPTGLVLVSGLAPRDRKLSRAYKTILARYGEMDLESFGADRFYASFDYISAADHLARAHAAFEAIALPEDPAPEPQPVS